MMMPLCRWKNTQEQEVIRREFAMGLDDPDRMSTQLLLGNAYQTHPYRCP